MNLAVLSWVGIPAVQKVGKNYTFLVNYVFLFQVEKRERFYHQIYEILSVFIVNKSVMENSAVFMIIKSHQIDCFRAIFLGGWTNSLKDFPNISEIESIVRFFRSRQKFWSYSVINNHYLLSHDIHILQNTILEFPQEVFGKLRENSRNCIIIKFRVGENIKMSYKPSSNIGPASSGGSHGSKQSHVLQEHKLKIFSIVPALVVQVLTENFDGRLGPIIFLFRHVEIIDENYTFFAHWRSVVATSAFVHFGIDGVLGLVCTRLRRKCQCVVLKLITHFVQ